MGNKDKTRDGDTATKNKDSRANRDHSQDQEAARDAALAKTIAEAVALQTQSIAEMLAKQNREAAKETQSIAEMFAKTEQRSSKGDPVYGRSIYKANGEGSCAISGLIEGKSRSHLTNYP